MPHGPGRGIHSLLLLKFLDVLTFNNPSISVFYLLLISPSIARCLPLIVVHSYIPVYKNLSVCSYQKIVLYTVEGCPPELARRKIQHLSCLRVDYPHPNDPPKEPLMRIIRFLPPEPLQLLMVEEGLNPQVVVHLKSLKLLGQGKVCKDHFMDLNCNKLVCNQWRPDLLRLPVVLTGSPLQTSWEKA